MDLKQIHKIILLLLLSFGVANSFAQNKKKVEMQTVSGIVSDSQGTPVQQVFVTVGEGKYETQTDEEGKFSIEVPANSVFLFEKNGFKNIIISIGELNMKAGSVVLEETNFLNQNHEVAYRTSEQYKNTGAVSFVDVEKQLDRDVRRSVGNAVAANVPGLAGLNIHGRSSVIVIDGVVRDGSFLSLNEVAEIAVLRDPMSRMLYGADADQGVIMITTKKGQANKKVMRFDGEVGVMNQIDETVPVYLDAAGQMEAYNKAYMNDGQTTPYYSQETIDATRSGVDPVLYPDNDYMNEDYRNTSVKFTNLFGEISGGNRTAQYIVTLGWQHNEGWLNKLATDKTDKFYVRGKSDIKVSDWIDARVEFLSNMEFQKQSTGVSGFWNNTRTMLPQTAPMLIPLESVSNEASLERPLYTYDGQYLLGGNSIYRQNFLGELLYSGETNTNYRYTQFNTGFNFDLASITEGLTAKASLGYDFYNSFSEKMNRTYAVYDPMVVDGVEGYEVTQEGLNKESNERVTDNGSTLFQRYLTGYATLNYDRVFGDHDISLVGLTYFSKTSAKAEAQDDSRLRYGVQANYTFKKRYVLEAGLINQASKKTMRPDTWGLSGSVGAAWVISNEDFFPESSAIDYLKLRGTYGRILNDDFNNWLYRGYYMYQPAYTESGSYTYDDGNANNTVRYVSIAGNPITWQKRDEYVIGFESSLFNHSLYIEASGFKSVAKDMVTTMDNSTPGTMGNIVQQFANYNSTSNYGFEVGTKFMKKFGDFSVDLSLNYMYNDGKYEQLEEPEYNLATNKHLTQQGTSTNSRWGLSTDGLYSPEDFDVDGNLLAGMSVPTWGNVSAGDIKYIDYNNDGIINSDDRHIIADSGDKHFGSIALELKYKRFSLYTMGRGAMGGTTLMNSPYFLPSGNQARYTEMALLAYDPQNPDPNASYPKLTLGNNVHNKQASDFYMVDDDWFSIETIQLAYEMPVENNQLFKRLRLYGRIGNVAWFSKEKRLRRISYGYAPKSTIFAGGIVASF